MAIVLRLLLLQSVLLASILPKAYSDTSRARAYVFKSTTEANEPYEPVGIVDFIQEDSYVMVNGTISGLQEGEHGFHVHEKGDLGDGCLNAGDHFNPSLEDHGGPDDSSRHAGDLGNIVAAASGIASISMTDQHITLNGPDSIVGRSIVIHENADDLGKEGTEESRTTGSAGGRIACGVIGIAE